MNCNWCGMPMVAKQTGRPRRFCSARCRKAHARAFPKPPHDLRPLPDPGPLPKHDAETRIVFAISNVYASEVELRDAAHEVPAALAGRCLKLAEDLRRDVDSTFGGVFSG